MKNKITKEKASLFVDNFDIKLIQSLIILLFMTFIGFFLLEKKLIYGFLFLIIMPIYMFFLLKKYLKMKKILTEIKNKELINLMINKINQNLFLLYSFFIDIGLDKERIDFTINKFNNQFKECKKINDYEFLLNQIINDYEKYKNVYKNFTINELNEKQEIINALEILLLPENTKDFNLIKKQHRKLSKLYHPENKIYNNIDDNINLEQKQKEINQAYNILKKIYG